MVDKVIFWILGGALFFSIAMLGTILTTFMLFARGPVKRKSRRHKDGNASARRAVTMQFRKAVPGAIQEAPLTI